MFQAKLGVYLNASLALITMVSSVADFKRVSRLRPEALKVYRKNEDGEKELAFRISNGEPALGDKVAYIPFKSGKSKDPVKVAFHIEGEEVKYTFASTLPYIKEIDKQVQKELKAIEETTKDIEEV